MTMLILDAGAMTTLAGLNAAQVGAHEALTAVPLVNGNHALSTDLLTDCGAGQTWAAWGSFLQGLPTGTVLPGDFVQPQEPA